MSRASDRAGTKASWRIGLTKHYGVKAHRNVRRIRDIKLLADQRKVGIAAGSGDGE